MKQVAVAVILLSACISEEDPEAVSTVAQGVRGNDCSKDLCGNNSPELTNGFFHELNLDQLPNAEGFSIVGLVKNGSYYKMNVVNGKISGTFTIGHVGAPMSISGDALEGSYIRLKRVVDGVTSYRRITITSVARATDYWAKPLNRTTDKIETYLFMYGPDEPQQGPYQMSAYVCHDGAQWPGIDPPVAPMPYRHALVFEGDRIDVPSLRVGTTMNTRWFNIGCAKTALAKMQLNGVTHAAKSQGFSTTPEMRTAFLKMMTADYCDRGVRYAFTVPGQPLHYRDSGGSMPQFSGLSTREAHWSWRGATCLNRPRLEANPSVEGDEAFPDLDASILMACGGQLPPPCDASSTPYLASFNPFYLTF